MAHCYSPREGLYRQGAFAVGADGIRVGRRVWVARENDRVYGRVASLTPAIFAESSPGFVSKSAKALLSSEIQRWGKVIREQNLQIAH